MTTDYRYLYENLQDQWQAEKERRWEEQRRERQERLEEVRQRAREYECEAADWFEAFDKGLPRFVHEAHDEQDWMDAQEKPYFLHHAIQTAFAQAAYKAEMASRAARIKRILDRANRLVELIEAGALEEVAQQVDAAFGTGTAIAKNLRDNDYEALVNW